MPRSPVRLSNILWVITAALAWALIGLWDRTHDDRTSKTRASNTPDLKPMASPRMLLEIDDALVSDSNPVRTDVRGLDFERCARLHNYLVAYGWMAYHRRGPEDLNDLITRSSFFALPRDDSEVPRGRLDDGLIAFLESIILPSPSEGLSYWVGSVDVRPADELFFIEQNDLNNKERFVVLYASWLEHGSHAEGLVYDQQRHQVAMTLCQENFESVSPVDEHLDMWVPLEVMLTNWIHMIRIGKVGAGPPRREDGVDEDKSEPTAANQLGAWIWQPYSPAQVESAVAAIERLSAAIEARMPPDSLLPVESGDAPLLTHADLDAASVPRDCFLRSVLTKVRAPQFRHIAPGLEVPHDGERFVAQQQFAGRLPPRNEEGNEIIPPVLIFAAADKWRTVGFNEEIRWTLTAPSNRNEKPLYKDGHPILAGLYSECVRRGDADIAEEGFRLLLPFGLRPDYSEGANAPRRSDGSFVDARSHVQLFQFGAYHPYGGEWRAQRLEKLMDRWRELVESGIWSVGRDGVQGSIDVFANPENWRNYWIKPDW